MINTRTCSRKISSRRELPTLNPCSNPFIQRLCHLLECSSSTPRVVNSVMTQQSEYFHLKNGTDNRDRQQKQQRLTTKRELVEEAKNVSVALTSSNNPFNNNFK